LVDTNKDANVWRNEEANRSTFDDDVLPILFDAIVLHKAKQAELNRCLQLYNNDSIKNLQIAKHIILFQIIHNKESILLYV